MSFGLCHECKDENCERCIGPPCECPCPVPSWFLYTTKEPGHGDVLLWWRAGGAGYSRYLEEAGIFTREQAESFEKGSEVVHGRSVRAADICHKTTLLRGEEGEGDGVGSTEHQLKYNRPERKERP